jgi:hypothetical protein
VASTGPQRLPGPEQDGRITSSLVANGRLPYGSHGWWNRLVKHQTGAALTSIVRDLTREEHLPGETRQPAGHEPGADDQNALLPQRAQAPAELQKACGVMGGHGQLQHGDVAVGVHDLERDPGAVIQAAAGGAARCPAWPPRWRLAAGCRGCFVAFGYVWCNPFLRIPPVVGGRPGEPAGPAADRRRGDDGRPGG